MSVICVNRKDLTNCMQKQDSDRPTQSPGTQQGRRGRDSVASLFSQPSTEESLAWRFNLRLSGAVHGFLNETPDRVVTMGLSGGGRLSGGFTILARPQTEGFVFGAEASIYIGRGTFAEINRTRRAEPARGDFDGTLISILLQTRFCYGNTEGGLCAVLPVLSYSRVLDNGAEIGPVALGFGLGGYLGFFYADLAVYGNESGDFQLIVGAGVDFPWI